MEVLSIIWTLDQANNNKDNKQSQQCSLEQENKLKHSSCEAFYDACDALYDPYI